jgi:hypothetical protein
MSIAVALAEARTRRGQAAVANCPGPLQITVPASRIGSVNPDDDLQHRYHHISHCGNHRLLLRADS